MKTKLHKKLFGETKENKNNIDINIMFYIIAFIFLIPTLLKITSLWLFNSLSWKETLDYLAEKEKEYYN